MLLPLFLFYQLTDKHWYKIICIKNQLPRPLGRGQITSSQKGFSPCLNYIKRVKTLKEKNFILNPRPKGRGN